MRKEGRKKKRKGRDEKKQDEIEEEKKEKIFGDSQSSVNVQMSLIRGLEDVFTGMREPSLFRDLCFCDFTSGLLEMEGRKRGKKRETETNNRRKDRRKAILFLLSYSQPANRPLKT